MRLQWRVPFCLLRRLTKLGNHKRDAPNEPIAPGFVVQHTCDLWASAVRLFWVVLGVSVSHTTLAVTHEYQLEVAAGLEQISVTAQLQRKGLTLRARKSKAADLLELQTCSGDRIAKPNGNRIDLPDEVDCVIYTAPLASSEQSRRFRIDLPNAQLTSPSRWMWLPAITDEDRISVELTLPKGARASLPWRYIGAGRFEFGTSPKSGFSMAVIGDFIELDIPGIKKPAAYVGAKQHKQKIARWLSASASMLRGIGGRVPNDEVQILVLPVTRSRGRSPVPFGRVVRDQGESIQFFVDLTQADKRYLQDWTAPHEFAHTLLPFVGAQWVSEGFSGYYQNVLLARGGIYSEQQAWQHLVNSFGRAADVKNPPSPNETSDRPFWEVRMLLYWSGAALALMADAEIRFETGNAGSLDSVLATLAKCCLPSGHTWTSRELFIALDQYGAGGIGRRLYDKHADARGMPGTADVLAKLGVVVVDKSVTLDDAAPWAHVRKAIMSGTIE